MGDIHNYDDIINLPHHVSVRHPRMSSADRAAQFSPFAALTGHDAAIKETARLTDGKIELTEDAKSMLDVKLHKLAENISAMPQIKLTWFVGDERKSGGKYITAEVCVKSIDDFNRIIALSDGRKIPLDDIYEMESELFSELT